MAKSYRKGRLGEEIKRIVGEMILHEIKDPRITGRMVSVTDVDVSPDGSYATIYLSVLGVSVSDDAEQDEKESVLAGMKKASGYIRSTIGKRNRVRHVPELSFRIDESMEYGRHMSAVLDNLEIPPAEEDAEVSSEEPEHLPDPSPKTSDELEEYPDYGQSELTGNIDYSQPGDEEEPGRDEQGFQNSGIHDIAQPRRVYQLEKDHRTEYFEKISQCLLEADSMYIYPHMVADGDAMGSCASLCRMMRDLGKEADIIMEDEIPDNLTFLNKDYVIFADNSADLPQRDLSIALDCSNIDRFPKRREQVSRIGRRTACIDHHEAHVEFAEVSLIDGMAAATTELMYELYLYMNLPISVEAAEAIYTGIVTDTGNFQYTNTTRKTHLIAADLYDLGINTKKLNIILYQSDRPQKLRLHSDIMSHMDIFCGGRASIAYVTLQMYDNAGAKLSESDGINSAIRDIQGVEVAVFLRETVDHEIKVGFRSKSYIDVAEICVQFGGGGHRHAAGCTIQQTMDETLALMRGAVEHALQEYDRQRALSGASEEVSE